MNWKKRRLTLKSASQWTSDILTNGWFISIFFIIIWTEPIFNEYRSYMAEMKFFVKQLNRTITGRETGSNKQSASRSCALSLVRQLFHLGVIEAFSGQIKAKSYVKINRMRLWLISKYKRNVPFSLNCKGMKIKSHHMMWQYRRS